GVAGKHDHRRLCAAPRPQVDDAAFGKRFAGKAAGGQAACDQRLATCILRGDRGAGNQFLDQLQYRRAVHQALSSSLMLVLARVCASTRLTMTAQYRLCDPSAEGSEPGTTTEPAGTRPYRISPVLRS